jgi:diguanylate cyclase (GGDEF)-like protein
MAILEWPIGDTDVVAHVSEGSTASRGDVAAWARRARLDERRSDGDEPELLIGESRDLRLRSGAHYQVRLRLTTFEMQSGMLVLEGSSALHTEAALGSARAIASHIALVLQDRSVRAQVEKLSQRNRERAETLNQILEISNDLKKNRTLDDLFQSIATAVARSLGFQEVVLSIYDRDRNVFSPRAHFGLGDRWTSMAGRDVPAGEITRHWTEKNRVSKSYHVREASPREPVRASRNVLDAGEDAWKSGELLWIPLYAEDRLLGCLSVDEPRSGQSPRVEAVRSLEIFANQAVTAIENARSYNEAHEQSIRDSLTGAYNHRHFQEVLQRELGRAERVGRPLTVLMLDIDDFKSINDRFGHPVGDAILQGIVAEIRSEVRGDMDLLARYGGDEFALVLPETPVAEAVLVAERVRRRVDERLFRMPDSREVLRATVSIGLAAFPDDAREKRSSSIRPTPPSIEPSMVERTPWSRRRSPDRGSCRCCPIEPPHPCPLPRGGEGTWRPKPPLSGGVSQHTEGTSMASRALCLGLFLVAAVPALGAPKSETSDAYVLQRGAQTFVSGSLDDLERLRRKFSGDFLWFRRSGTEYVIQDPDHISEAEDLFSPLEALSPEQEELSRQEAALDREEESIDSERDEIEAEREELDARDESVEDAEAESAARDREAELDEREHSLDERSRELRARQRALSSEERKLEAREEELERAAEAKLWQLLDRSIGDGRAERLR